ncbi:transcriptional regulator, ArsR family [Methanosalsum zhilinae DSM 4017]|uniref:Transcriptional regulator, ArsR family n=1 Tax=Methanosalsum zhilinae (strain DSM 4017 / NBRC 107636 / OCM 62 / WeN5) TaxID=679901 RepID=F7XKR5_METZD|nr:ArsR family transcriptional regulator [Methanosalsum zhilinae]AEH61778.1 transcriptional regulator, ArsR family [Methanosalsum zhilinae DSM 4017]
MNESEKTKKIFKALGCVTRLNILHIVCNNEMHITGIAKKLNISVPVALKHVRILEDAGLVTREIFGNSHILKADTKGLYHVLDHFAPEKDVEVNPGESLLDALKRVSSIEMRKVGDREVIVSTDGEEGFFVYEVDGKLLDRTVQECTFEDDAVVEWKKLEPVTKLKLNIMVRNSSK